MITIRSAHHDDLAAIAHLDSVAFATNDPDDAAPYLPQWLTSGPWLVAEHTATTDADRAIVGVAGTFGITLTVPGQNQVPVPGVSWVSVAPTHRRLGILRQLLSALHTEYVGAGHAISVLTASEATIYERFGYGPATMEQTVRIDRRTAALRSPAPGPTTATIARRADDHIRATYSRWHRQTNGSVSREWQWSSYFDDPISARAGGSVRKFLIHPDGYVAYRVNDATLRVRELVALTDAAYADLWQALLGFDGVDTIVATIAPGDPIAEMLVDRRSVKLESEQDGLWLKLLDIPAALELRSWDADFDGVLEVTAAADGAVTRYELTVRDHKAQCRETSAASTVSLADSVLAAVYLGGFPLSTYARAGRVTGDWYALDRALRTATAPRIGNHF